MFDGRLLQLGNDVFPLKFVFKETYTVTPNRVQDLDPYTTETGVLIRNPVEHEPSTISFQTKPMNNLLMNEMMAFIKAHYVNEKRRDLNITYYSPEADDYKQGTFYFNTNLEYNMNLVDVDNKTILYNSMQIDFIVPTRTKT